MSVIDQSTNSVIDLTEVSTAFLEQSSTEFDARLRDILKLAYIKTANKQLFRFPVNTLLSSGLQEWAGQRHSSSVLKQGMTVTTKRYNDGVDLDETDFTDGGIADPNLLANDLWNLASVLPGRLLATLINNGSSENGFDGVPFFSVSHPIKGSTVGANLVGSSALTQASLDAGIVAFRKWPRTDGTPRDSAPDTLVVPPSLSEVAATYVFTNQLLAIGSNNSVTSITGKPTNVIKNLLVLGQLEQASISGSASNWYLSDLSQIRKPLMMGITDINASSETIGYSDAATLISAMFKLGRLGFDSEHFKLKKQVKFFIDAWLGASYGDPSLMFKFQSASL
jgi:phage major head subunit gpT-like protein